MNQVSPVPTLARLSRTDRQRRVPRFRTQKTENCGKNCPKRSSNRCHAFANSQYTRGTYAPVCGKRATLLGNADESRRMTGTGQAAGMLSGQLFGPGGQDHSRVIGSTGGQCGPLEGATAEKAVPFPCAARRSLDLRGRSASGIRCGVAPCC